MVILGVDEINWRVIMYEYLGIYNEPFVELHVVKIMADTKEKADKKFIKYLNSRDVVVWDDSERYVIPLFSDKIETIY